MKMKNDLLKDIKMKILWLTSLFIISSISVFGQVNISTSIFPPYSPYYADYSGVNATKVLVIVQNLTQNTLRIKLSGSLESRTIDIHTRNNFIPLQPLILPPHAIVQLNGNRIKDIFDINNLSVKGIDIATLGQTSRLPEGDYQFCITAIDMNDNKTVLSAPGTGCTFLPIIYPDAPVLSSPGQTVIATNPQSVIFSWFNPAAVPFSTQYRIELAEMPDVTSDPNHVLDATSFPMLSQTVTSYSYLYSIQNLQLIPGKKYAWRVTASDPTGKTVFKHNGVSPASYFIYAKNDGEQPFKLAQEANLSVITPACDSPAPTVLLGPNFNLQTAWLWQNQSTFLKEFGTLDTMLLKHYTSIATAKGHITLGKYKLEYKNIADNKVFYTGYANAPDQNFSLDKSSALHYGFRTGQTYTVTVTSLDVNGGRIESATSCPWLLKDEQDGAKPKLNISGRLTYALNEAGITHGANNVSITVQLVDKARTKNISDLKDYTSVTTDDDGNFKVQLAQSPSDTGRKYLLLHINNPYYKQLDTSVSILKVPPITYSATNAVVQIKQDMLKMGEIQTLAYTNTLTVNVKKGFPDKLTKLDSEDIFGDDAEDYTGVPVDALSIDPTAIVPDGTRVVLYRKAKASDIPYFETNAFIGKLSVHAADENAKLLSGYGINPKYLYVTETTTHKDVNGKATAVFNNMLCNFENNDEYFIKAILPDTGINKASELTGPEQRYVYKPALADLPRGPYFKRKFDYSIISQKPPTAHIKGKVMYEWPSLPGVLHPYANKPVRVTYRLRTVLASNSPPSQCSNITYAEVTPGKNGAPLSFEDYNITNQVNTLVVGQAVTDAGGNFDITIVTLNQMGKIPNLVPFSDGKQCPPGPVTGDIGNAIIDHGIAVLNSPPTPGGNVENPGNQVINPGEGDGGADFSKLVVETPNANAMLFKQGIKGAKSYTQPSEAGAVIIKGVRQGPSGENNEPENPETDDVTPGYVERYYTLDGIPGRTKLNSSNPNDPGNFIVQPFQTIDLGVIVTDVAELSNFKVQVVAQNDYKGNVTDLVAGAIVTVYRHNTSNDLFIPDGEGSFKHLNRPLPAADFAADPKAASVEWVIDHSFKLDKNQQVHLDSLRLIPPSPGGSQYMVVVTPDPNASGGGSFSSYPRQVLYQKGYSPLILTAKPLESRISGRVIDQNSQKPIANAWVILNIIKPAKIATPDNPNPQPAEKIGISLQTDKNGYYEVRNTMLGSYSWPDNSPLSIQASAGGYASQNSFDTGLKLDSLGKNYNNNISLSPGRTLTFIAVDGDQKDGDMTFVPGMAMSEDSTIVYNDGPFKSFTLLIPSTGSHYIHVIPIDPAYFQVMVPLIQGAIFPNTIKMYKRLHRMQFQLTNKFNNKKVDVNSFSIFINDIHISNNTKGLSREEIADQKALYNNYKPVYDPANGTISFNFANVSVNNFDIKIVNTGNEGFTALEFNLQNSETATPVIYPVKLSPGASIAGKVTYKGQPVQNAKIYLEYAAQAEESYGDGKDLSAKSLMETRSLKDGTYAINGIPISGLDQQVIVHATLDTNVTVPGLVKKVNTDYLVVNKADFDLKSFTGPTIKSVYGFPLSVESIESTKAGYKITGIVDLGKNNSGFKMLSGNEKFRVSDVVFEGDNNNISVAGKADVPLEATVIMKMKYLGQYNVKLKSPGAVGLQAKPLQISASGTGGVVNALVSIVDNSFNYPSTYLSFTAPGETQPIPFNLIEKTGRDGLPKTMILPAIYNAPAKNTTYHLANDNGAPLQFSFIGFYPTSANPANSYIDPATKNIHLDVSFKGTIPNSDQGYADVHIKDITLDGYSIKPTTGAEPLAVKLQDWTLYVPHWTIDPTKGGIQSSDAYVSTGIVDIPAAKFNLRSDLFVLDGFQTQSIALGGGAALLTSIDTAHTRFLFDNACGSDHGAHWRFSAVGVNGAPAAILPLPDLSPKFTATNLAIDYFQLISYNNENIINLAPVQNGIKMYGNNKFTFFPAGLSSGNGTFSVIGTANIDVPRIGSTALSIVYNKTGNTLTADAGGFKPVHFEGKGYVQFTSDDGALFTTSGNSITSIKGKVVELGKFNPIPCTFTFGQKLAPAPGDVADNGTILLQDGYNLRMDGDGIAGPNDLALSLKGTGKAVNGMAVDDANTDWNTLTFSGELNDPKSNSTNGGTADKMQDTSTVLTFNVLGDLNVSSSHVQMNNIKTPLGDLVLTYDFPSHELRGSLHMNQVKFGEYAFTGDIQSTMGPNGMLLLGAGQLNTGTLFVNGFGTLNIGLLFGNTDLTDDNINTVTKYSHAKNSLCWLDENKTGFKGFFFTGGLDIIDEHDGVNLGIAAAYFNANLGVEASVGANFANKNYMMLLGAHGSVSAGLTSFTGTTISGGLDAHLTAVATYSPDGFNVNGDAAVDVKFTISQYIPIVGTKSISGEKTAQVKFGTGPPKSYFNFSLSNDGGAVVCTKNANVE